MHYKVKANLKIWKNQKSKADSAAYHKYQEFEIHKYQEFEIHKYQEFEMHKYQEFDINKFNAEKSRR